MGQRQHEVDARGLDPAPASGQMPEQQVEPDLQPGVAADRAHGVHRRGAAAGTVHERMGDLRPRPDALGELGVEQRQPGRRQYPPDVDPGEHLLNGANDNKEEYIYQGTL